MNGDRPGRLLELAVVDLALIDRLRLQLGPGLSVLTGETGAGKSLLIDALGLATGGRADASLVRHGADLARIEALFERTPEPLICVREIAAVGRSTARVDDDTVTAARLAEVAGPLVEIHGQHEQQRLLDSRWQRELLDAHGGLAGERAAMADAVGAWRANQAALAELTGDPRELARRLELAQHEAAEIAAARLHQGEVVTIEARLAAARHGEAIARGAGELMALLLGDAGGEGESGGARESAGAAAQAAADLGRLDPRFGVVAGRLAGVQAELDDVAGEVRRLAESVDHDPAELARLTERLSVIYALERRYGDDEAAVIAHGEQAAAEANRLRELESSRDRRLAESARLLERVATAAAALSVARRLAGDRLARAVEDALRGLGMGKTRFSVALGRRPAQREEPAVEVDGDAVAFDATGVDETAFLIAPNPGEPARPLSRIASGGELSRVALAIKEVLATSDATPTLVFDEIDSGIGGRSADPVARSLWTLGRSHQVLCVTHLPQIAAHADAHYRIRKVARGGRTVTEVSRLDGDERVAELAAMIGGPDGGSAAAASAVELLERASAWRGTPARRA